MQLQLGSDPWPGLGTPHAMGQDGQKGKKKKTNTLQFFFFFFGLFASSRAIPTAYGGSQARDPIGAIAASLCQRHSNVGSKPLLQPPPQREATRDP